MVKKSNEIITIFYVQCFNPEMTVNTMFFVITS